MKMQKIYIQVEVTAKLTFSQFVEFPDLSTALEYVDAMISKDYYINWDMETEEIDTPIGTVFIIQ